MGLHQSFLIEQNDTQKPPVLFKPLSAQSSHRAWSWRQRLFRMNDDRLDSRCSDVIIHHARNRKRMFFVCFQCCCFFYPSHLLPSLLPFRCASLICDWSDLVWLSLVSNILIP
ncbi:hypothetical protein BDV26DRAFT_4540 [Aspergillus bertholletiae]|uniref:Uncharacterized protein n=1 Tax=Aspergillus bertholletiae TaxID=1226010 RepID=A0A5N7BL34_9EURO|nr:hypothetical protein BDV26DRAFT_4540 [Aspergillus bertholletiae]